VISERISSWSIVDVQPEQVITRRRLSEPSSHGELMPRADGGGLSSQA